MKTRKIVALLLAVVMVFALGASALAVDSDGYTSCTLGSLGLILRVSTDVEGLTITGSGSTASITASGDNDMPQALSLLFLNSDGSDFDTEAITVSIPEPAAFEFYTEEGHTDPKIGYGAVTLADAARVLTITRNNVTATVSIAAPSSQGGSSAAAPETLAAYLPAAGQFMNEGATGSGWGGPFTASGASTLKALAEGYVTTGVSLGAFGGYAVLDFGAIKRTTVGKQYISGGIYNDPNNAYGVDFILYGNAMNTWAEPGCVQVSQDGSEWYNLAGSLHYREPEYRTNEDGTTTVSASGSVWQYSATYTNPATDDDDGASGTTGTSGLNVPYTSTSKARPTSSSVSGSGEVVFNNWHRHSYFPLYNNYFVALNGRTAPLDGLLTPISGLDLSDFGSYTAKTSSAAASLTLNGVRLVAAPDEKNANGTTQPDNFLFGYVDCHPNGINTSEQVNPYSTGRTTVSNSNGDPMDISWAVDENGTPVELDAIRYVRVYTGVQQTNGVMGESSTELLGSRRATLKGTGTATSDAALYYGEEEDATPMNNNAKTEVESGTYYLVSSEDYVFVNGVNVGTEAATEVGYEIPITSGQVVQIITQSGNESPFLTVLVGK